MHSNNIPQLLRRREGLKLFNAAHAPISITQHASRLKPGQTLALDGFWRIGPHEADISPLVQPVILQTGKQRNSGTRQPHAACARLRFIAGAGRSKFCSAPSKAAASS